MKILLFALGLMCVCGVGAAQTTLDDEACSSEPIYHCRAGSGDTTVLFVHGWGGRAAFWREQLDYFSSDYNVISVELPGHGHSHSVLAEPTVAGLSRTLSKLVEQLDLARVVLVGHDMGAFIALVTADNMQERISALVAVESLVDTRITMPKRQFQQVLKSLEQNFVETSEQMTRDLFADSADAAVVQRITHSVASMDQELALNLLDDFFRADFAPALKRYAGDVVILNSSFNPPQLGNLRRLKPQIMAPTVPWQSHFAFIENPQQFNRKLEQVLDKLQKTEP